MYIVYNVHSAVRTVFDTTKIKPLDEDLDKSMHCPTNEININYFRQSSGNSVTGQNNMPFATGSRSHGIKSKILESKRM